METQSAFMAAAAAGALLVAVLLRRHDWPALRFAALCLCFGLWSLARGATGLGLEWGSTLGGLALAFAGPAAFAFTVGSIPSRDRDRDRRIAPLVWAAAPLAALAALGATDERGPWIETGLLVWAASGVALGGASLWRECAPGAAGEPPEATRLRYLGIAHALLCAAFAVDLGLWLLGAPRVATLLAGLLYLYAGYQLLARLRIADLRQLLGNALALALLAAGLAAVFAALRIWLGPRIDLFVLNAFVASCLLLLFYPAVRGWIQLAIERRFVADKVELERTLLPLRERLGQVFTLDELLRDLLATLGQTERITASSVFLREDPHLGFQQAASTGLSRRPRVNLIREPVFLRALEAGEVLLSEELDRELDARSEERRAELQALRRILRELDAQLVLPLRSGAQLVGFWTLTDWKQKEPFSSSEVELLASVAAAAAISIENSKTFERIRARDRLASLGEMAAGLAHELRNPLATIRGALAVLQESEDEPRSELSDVVVEEVLRLDRVVGAFLDYARPSLHRARIVDFATFVTDSVEAAARRLGLRDLDVELEVDGELPPVTTDRFQLETVIENVIQNASDAVGGAGQIRVAVHTVPGDASDAEAVEISIRDDGPGMDEETLERAFIPFYTTKDRGSGLGLALCERLVQAQGGTIELHSKPGEGTVVTLRLPTDVVDPEVDPERTVDA